jgi:hypothetical protein
MIYLQACSSSIFLNQATIWEEQAYDGHGCNSSKSIPECQFYPETGKLKDEEVIGWYSGVLQSNNKRYFCTYKT